MSESTFSQRYASADSNTAGAFAFDTISAKDYAVSKLAFGAVGSVTYVSSADPLPVTISGVATAANQTTANGLLTTIDADTGNIATSAASIDTKTPALGQALAAGSVPVVLPAAQISTLTPPAAITGFATETTLATIAGAVSGTEVQADIVAALPSGTNTIGAVNLAEYTAVSGRLPVDGSGVTQPVSDGGGTLSVDDGGGSVTVDGTVAVTDGGGTISIDDGGGAITVDGSVTVTGEVDVLPSSPIATEYLPIRLSDGSAFLSAMPITDNSGSITVDDGGGTLTVDGTVTVQDGGGSVTVDNSGTFAVQASQSGTWTVQPGNTANTTAWLVTGTGGTFPVTGTFWQATQPVSNAGTFAVQVDGTALTKLTDIETNTDSGAVVGNGTAATAQRVTLANDSTGIVALTTSTASIGKLAANTGVTIGAVEIASTQTLATVTTVGTVTTLTGGGVAHDGADSGNPVKVGAKATTALSGLTLVANSDRTDLFAGVDGVQITRNHTNLEDIVVGNASNTDGTSTEVIAAAGSGIKQYLTSVTLTNMSATGIYVEMKSGTTVRWRFPVPANSGVTHRFDPPLPPNAANEAWNFDPSAAATTIYCSAMGFKSKV